MMEKYSCWMIDFNRFLEDRSQMVVFKQMKQREWSHSPEYQKGHTQRKETDDLSLQHQEKLQIWVHMAIGEEATNRWLIESLFMDPVAYVLEVHFFSCLLLLFHFIRILMCTSLVKRKVLFQRDYQIKEDWGYRVDVGLQSDALLILTFRKFQRSEKLLIPL